MKRGDFLKSLATLIASPLLINKINWDGKPDIETSVGEVILLRKTQKTIRVHHPEWAKKYQTVRTENINGLNFLPPDYYKKLTTNVNP